MLQNGNAFTIVRRVIFLSINEGQPIPFPILLFVYLHELTHVGSTDFNHGTVFWTEFKWLLRHVKRAYGYDFGDLLNKSYGKL